MFAVFKKEFKNYFFNPIGYIFMSIFFAISGILFFLNIVREGSANLGGFYSSLFLTIIFSMPILTMGLFSDEYRMYTDKLLFSCPIRPISVVLGKYISAIVVFLLSISITLIYILIISFFATISLNLIVGCLLGTILLGCSLISIGIFVSSLSKNLVISAFGTFAIFMFFTFINEISKYIPIEKIRNFLDGLAVLPRYNSFVIGVLKVTDILYFLSVNVIFIFLTVAVLLKKRWS